ncbi:AAA family ATPase [Vibrio spartinae]|uniref:AAA domain (Dynein-related subfamily) n=1 Tax=Vibrio spartinae TaxID=1918945 RepID=A0ABX6R744_9VIBR|nr:AAA family ATPase [Vibrio spartinae]QMV16895.1 AAA domain (dynein-related subfamily) [Vibrio spartinae]
MASSKKNNGNQPQNNVATTQTSNDKTQLEKQIPMWTASFKNASQVYDSLGKKLNISLDEDYLKSLINALPDEKTSQFRGWIQQFADVCKEINKYKQGLDEEYKVRWDTSNQKGLELEALEEKLHTEQDELCIRTENLGKQSNELDLLQTKLAKQQSEQTSRERELNSRELNANQGFERQNRESLEQLKIEQEKEIKGYKLKISELSKQKSELEHAIEAAKLTLSDTEQQRKAELDKKEIELISLESTLQVKASELDKEKEQLKLKLSALEGEKAAYKATLDLENNYQQETIERQRKEIQDTLDLERKQLDDEWEDLREAKDNLDSIVDERMDEERESHQKEISKQKQKINNAWNKVEQLSDKLLDFEELQHSLGEQPIREFIDQLDQLKQNNRELKNKLSDTDHGGLEEQNENLRARVAELEKELTKIRPEFERVQSEAAQKRIAATQLQAIQQEKRVLEQHKNTLSVHIDDLESRIEKLTDAHKTQTPFPAMSNMDSNKNFQATMELEDVPDLSIFASELQQRIAHAEHVQLYYPLEDIRVLLGGLAMSQLHVFQGISGTGKTSLAKAFAKAMGGFCTDIAVQAGWRDRDDLLGHYNAFERKFYEKDCLQALYQAQTPRWNNTCNVILLDEMNLSRPEQYFSEFLSALEKNDRQDRLISLSETALPNVPKGLKDGRQILVPQNVWFIGTSNHDETTNELADKTYDRAHVMTLPKQDIRFKIDKFDKANYSFSSLQRAFRQATQEHRREVEELLSNLSEHDITTQLADVFGLGWGNRFERQAKDFIPVMLASGATKGEALDHLLSSRIMRSGKVTGRYDINADEIGKMTDALKDFWVKNDIPSDPTKSLELLNTDRQRKERM